LCSNLTCTIESQCNRRRPHHDGHNPFDVLVEVPSVGAGEQLQDAHVGQLPLLRVGRQHLQPPHVLPVLAVELLRRHTLWHGAVDRQCDAVELDHGQVGGGSGAPGLGPEQQAVGPQQDPHVANVQHLTLQFSLSALNNNRVCWRPTCVYSGR